jgi:two-component system, sensor histidine kinase FlrB
MSSLPAEEAEAPLGGGDLAAQPTYPQHPVYPPYPKEEGREFLLQAFRSFAEAADSLERSYGMLRSEVARLNGELAASHAGLASSLEENRRMREHLDRILEGLPCGVLVVKAKKEISLINPEGRRLLGMIREEEVQPAEESKAGSEIPDEWRELLQRAESGASEQEQRFRDKDGDERWLAARHAAVKDAEPGEGGEACVSIFILRDVSEGKRLLREKDKLRREQALAEMSAILAHEIRNPLGSLELFAGLLAGAGLSAECRRWVEQVQAGLRTLAATVNNVLHFHSLPAPQRAPVDLGQLLDWAGGFLVPMARQARVELCLRNHLHGIWFAAERHRLEQILLNLVLNALRAMPGGGWVEISGHKIHDGERAVAVISVSDTGPGVLAGNGTKIFEPGFSTHAGSPGLGLAVCRKIVEQHGGRLAAGNRPGAGASFTLMFPLGEETLPETAAHLGADEKENRQTNSHDGAGQ